MLKLTETNSRLLGGATKWEIWEAHLREHYVLLNYLYSFMVVVFVFWDRVSQFSQSWPRTLYCSQCGRNLPVAWAQTYAGKACPSLHVSWMWGAVGEAGELPSFHPGSWSSEEIQKEPEKLAPNCTVPNNEGSQQLGAALSGSLSFLSEEPLPVLSNRCLLHLIWNVGLTSWMDSKPQESSGSMWLLLS